MKWHWISFQRYWTQNSNSLGSSNLPASCFKELITGLVAGVCVCVWAGGGYEPFPEAIHSNKSWIWPDKVESQPISTWHVSDRECVCFPMHHHVFGSQCHWVFNTWEPSGPPLARPVRAALDSPPVSLRLRDHVACPCPFPHSLTPWCVTLKPKPMASIRFNSREVE